MATWGQPVSLKGLTGPSGIDGSKIFFGQGAPTDQSASAKAGDIFFSTDQYAFYQRSSSGWPASGVSVQGPMGLNGIDGSFYTGTTAPAASLGTSGNGIYIQASGEIWIRHAGDAQWTDTQETIVGPQGPQGVAGDRGTYTYTGHGAPSNDLSSFSPGPARAGDLYYDLDNGPALYVLGS